MTPQHLDVLITEDSIEVQAALRHHFATVDAYRYNAASIRVRIIDPVFQSIPKLERIDRVEKILDQLPEELQQDIVFVLCLAPGDEDESSFSVLNHEFENPQVEPERVGIS